VKYNAQEIITGPQEHVIEDLVVMPDWPRSQKVGPKSALICKQDWFLQMCKEHHIELPDFMMPALEMASMHFLRVMYSEYRNSHSGQEPDWMNKLSARQKVPVRWEYWIQDAPIETDLIVPGFELTGIGYLTKDGGFIHDVCTTFDLWRLNGIKQLGFLHDPVIRQKELPTYASTFCHTRFLHSIDVGVLATLVGLNNGLSGQELLTLKTAAFSHDWRTPAGGDTMKAVDPELFDEDRHYDEKFSTAGFKEFRRKYGISQEALCSVIMQKGAIGRILDLADKVSYTARDVEYLLNQNSERDDIPFCYEFRRIREMLKVNPLICSIWDCARIRGKILVIEDADRLSDFLKLRALMFRTLYYNPASRFLEDGLIKVLAKYLFHKKIITLKELLAIGDQRLMEIMDKVIGQYFFLNSVSNDLNPRIERFGTIKEAYDRERELLKDPDIMIHLDESKLNKSSGLSDFMVWENGKAIAFPEARPDDAKEIRAITRTAQPFFLYIYSTEKLRFPKDLAQDLRKERLLRLAEVAE